MSWNNKGGKIAVLKIVIEYNCSRDTAVIPQSF